MINLNSADDLIKAIEALEKKLKATFERLSSLSIVELADLEAGIDFYQSLIDLGYEDRVNQFIATYDDVIKQALLKAKESGISGVFTKSFSDIEVIKEIDKRVLLGKARDYADRLERELIIGYATGKTSKEIKKSLDFIPLKDYQFNAMLNTYVADISRTASAKVYEGTDKRFKYFGPIVEHSSEECKWLILNQRKEGYTWDEIQKGIDTPFKHKSGPLAGQIKKIYWSGRDPNFNCLHEWIEI